MHCTHSLPTSHWFFFLHFLLVSHLFSPLNLIFLKDSRSNSVSDSPHWFFPEARFLLYQKLTWLTFLSQCSTQLLHCHSGLSCLDWKFQHSLLLALHYSRSTQCLSINLTASNLLHLFPYKLHLVYFGIIYKKHRGKQN